jgi:hypothetical protein
MGMAAARCSPIGQEYTPVARQPPPPRNVVEWSSRGAGSASLSPRLPFNLNLTQDKPIAAGPQLVTAGHGAVDDPDAAHIYNETFFQLVNLCSDGRDVVVVVVVRLRPSDQLILCAACPSHTSPNTPFARQQGKR